MDRTLDGYIRCCRHHKWRDPDPSGNAACRECGKTFDVEVGSDDEICDECGEPVGDHGRCAYCDLVYYDD